MLVLVLVAAATMRLCPLVRAQPLCRARTVRTGKVLNTVQKVDGDVLYFPSTTTRVIKHPCQKNVAVYLGLQGVHSQGLGSEEERQRDWQVGVPTVTSAHFVGSTLLLVVNRKVYIYNYKDSSWKVPIGIQHPVSHISGDHCCFLENVFCVDMSNTIFAYLRGEPVPQAHIYKSNTGGRRFKEYTYVGQAELFGSLGGIFHLYSLTQIGLLIIDRQKGTFKYSQHPLNRSLGLAFDYHETLDVLVIPGHRGLLILWSEKSLLYSHNSGQLIDSIPVKRGEQILYRSLLQANVTIHTVAFNENELAVLTKEDHLYYGSLRLLSSSIIKIEYLDGDFIDKMHTIDMHSELVFSATLITGLGTSPIPLVMVSNPHSLGLQASMSEKGNTLDGAILYRLDIYLKQQQHWGRTDPNFTSSVSPRSPVRSKISACSQGVLDPVTLQDNYSYIIENYCHLQTIFSIYVYGAYPLPILPPGLTIATLVASILLSVWLAYRVPRLRHTEKGHRIQRWKKGHFQEVIQAEYVLREVSGVFTYSYSLTAKAARCVSQPQNWTTIIQETGGPFWDRENYKSCHDSEDITPLQWPDVQYQILGGRTQNSIIFDQRNGIYVFFLSIVDPYYR
ncbi:PREDICTED: cation channel sperm-associated protein subunit delta [Propithecus coquereli]|uniref:cation channel sperm-associated protein subunit delta n=1 Tax=Propithecus coquereli TaxID=379532 RepID=UPI00063F62E0|nr:PREDICTED: cation channel sperm-associated protein subunit delta [Propithecus coquereli]